MRGEKAEKQYERLHWGIRPRRRRTIDVPGMRLKQTVVELGRLRALVLTSPEGTHSVIVRPKRPYPRLVVGQRDNRLYIADHGAFKLPASLDGSVIERVDYETAKGDEEAYYYHDHEPHFPVLRVLSGGLAQYAGGSYVVAPEGITG